MTKFSPTGALLLALAGLGAGSSVGLGAFAAHALGHMVADGARAVSLFSQATDFQMKQALGLLFVTLIAERVANGTAFVVLRAAALLTAAAMLLFPTALYSGAFGGPQFWAPWGGTAAMLGWLLFALGAVLAVRSAAEARAVAAQPAE